MKMQYKFYATLLDAFQNYLDSDRIWEKYWGWSETPPHTPEEYKEKQFHELINRINRVPFDSEAADRGTAFNEVVDMYIDNRKSDKVDISIELIGTVKFVAASYNERRFYFPLEGVKSVAEEYKEAITQQFVAAELPTRYGTVELYGYLDWLLPFAIVDAKTTGNYAVGKFKRNYQHIVYPYAMRYNGIDLSTFIYDVFEINKKGDFVGRYKETYVYDEARDSQRLVEHCEALIDFLSENKHLITDKKIFGEI